MIEFFEKHYAKEQDDLETRDMDVETTFEEKEKNPVLKANEEVVLTNPIVRFLFSLYRYCIFSNLSNNFFLTDK